MLASRRTVQRIASIGARSLSSKSAAGSGDHAPLIKLFGVPARYANAAYEAASKAGKLDAVEKDLKAFGDVINSNAEFATYLSNPTISRTSKVELIESIFDGKKTEPISKNLFATMAANARLADTGRVVEAFSELMKARRNEVSAIVTTAEKLSAEQEKALQESLKKQVDAGTKIVLETRVDPTLYGGLTVQVGDRFMDLSIASKIKQVRNSLTGSA